MRVAVAEPYQVGRAFIAGDAAHSHPPYGGFGLNNGLEDAVNLGWKLAARLQGWGSDALLASYSDERRPIFREMATDFIATRIRNDREFLERYNPSRDRAEFERAWNARARAISASARRCYEPGYEGSPVVAGPPGGKTTAHGQHMFKARSRAPSAAAAAFVRPRRVRGAGPRFHAAGLRRRRRSSCARSSRRRAR